MKLRPLPTKSFLLAPLASIPAATLAGLGSSDAGIASDLGWGLFLSILLAVPASYLSMLIIGLPLFYLLRGFKWLLLFAACTTGVVVPYALFRGAPFATIAMAVAAGLAVSIMAYLFRPTKPETKFPPSLEEG